MDILLKSSIVLLLLFLMLEDVRKREVSNKGNIFFLFLSSFYALRQGVPFEMILIFMAVYAFPLVFMYGYLSDLLQKEVLGFGDIKFVMGIGALMSPHSLWFSLYYFYLFSFCIAAILGILYYVLKKQKELAMLPAFCIALYIVRILL